MKKGIIGQMKKGITLVSLVITIVIMLILAGVGIYGSLALIEQAKYSAFINEMQQVEEAVAMYIMEKELESAESGEQIELFDSKLQLNEEQIAQLPQNLQNEINYIREKLAGTDVTEKIPSDYSYAVAIGDGKNICYLPSDLTNGKEEAYIYDEQSASVYKVEPTIIWGVEMHGYEYGNLLTTQTGLLERVKENNKTPSEEESINIGNVTVSVEELNGEYVKLNIQAENTTDVVGYGVLVNNELVGVSEENSILVSDLSCNTEYEVIGYAVNSDNYMKKSDILKVTTLEYQYLYSNGTEFESLTGGWQRGAYNTGSFTKESDHMNLYQNVGAVSTKYWNSCETIQAIDVAKYNKIKFKIKFDNTYFYSSDNLYCTWIIFMVCNPKFVNYDTTNLRKNISINLPESIPTNEIITFELDISDISEEIYPTISFKRWFGAAAFKLNADIYEIWFE